MGEIRVVIADDHQVFRDGLRALLDGQADITVAGQAGTVSAAVEMVAELTPDILLMDLNMPAVSGVTGISRMRRLPGSTRAIALSMHEDEVYLRAALAAGAAGYVFKSSPAALLLDAIRKAHADPSAIVIAQLDGSLQTLLTSPETRGHAPIEKLTLREQEVFERVALGHTHAEIGELLGLSTKTVDTYRRRVGEKLGLATRADLVRLALELGMLPPGPV